jgi:hypothetical protein
MKDMVKEIMNHFTAATPELLYWWKEDDASWFSKNLMLWLVYRDHFDSNVDNMLANQKFVGCKVIASCCKAAKDFNCNEAKKVIKTLTDNFKKEYKRRIK